MRIATIIRIVILLFLQRSYFGQENICPTTAGEKVVRACEGNFASGDSVYLDTFKAVNYQGSCACQLTVQGAAVDLQLTVHGVHTECDATLYFPPPIDYNYRCSVKAPSNTTGRIGSGQVVFLTLIKRSEVADFCVHLVQTSTTGGSLHLACFKGTLKSSSPLTTTSSQPNATTNVVTTSDTSVTESKDLTGGNSSGDNSTTTATESNDVTGNKSATTVTSGETQAITPAEVIGHNNTASTQSKFTVNFVVIGLVAAIVS